jgi:hypothetical protein
VEKRSFCHGGDKDLGVAQRPQQEISVGTLDSSKTYRIKYFVIDNNIEVVT